MAVWSGVIKCLLLFLFVEGIVLLAITGHAQWPFGVG